MRLSSRDRKWVQFQSYWRELLSFKGGKCECCGEDHISCLEFHSGSGDDPKVKRLLQSSGGLELSKSLVEDCNILCSNCHYDIHHLSSSGKCGVICSHCGYSGNDGCIESDGFGGMICRSCIRKSRFDESRYTRLRDYIDGFTRGSSCSVDIGYLLEDSDWVNELDRLWKSEMSLGEMVDHLLVGIGVDRSIGRKLLRGVIDDRIAVGKLSDRGMSRYRDMSDSELIRDHLVSRFIKFRSLGWSRSRLLLELGISRSRYDNLLRLLLDRDLVDYERAPMDYIDIDSDIVLLSGLGKSSVEIASELGCKVSTVRYKRRKLIRCGLMPQPDYGSYSRGRVAWNKGLKSDLSEDNLTDEDCLMIVMRDDGKTASEVALELGRGLSWVRNRYSQMIRLGIIDRLR